MNAAADRFFRAYARQCLDPDEDSLFALLNALHSFNDKLRKAGKGDLFGSVGFRALKALRNLFHHEMELLHEVKFIPAANLPVTNFDLGIVCLVDEKLVERAARREKVDQRDTIRGAFKWYGTVVNIQPCVFNVAVDVFEVGRLAGLAPESEAYAAFESSYRFEEMNGHSHRVTGEISCLAGSVDAILQEVFRQKPVGAAN
jgi:hypothetical protein